ncbi:Tetratricopeptide repeat protein 28 TPR repeat protein 28 [Flammeovirgaceae bacterium 311]|nr:Tetratricopeptide repeat protein 28 TPR repeat protein 28 [Flammeovirgaceae bacterium 311]
MLMKILRQAFRDVSNLNFSKSASFTSITHTHLLRKPVLTVVIVLIIFPVFGQVSADLNGNKIIEILQYKILADRNYSLERILTDTTLGFVSGDSLRPSQVIRYWLKIEAINRSRYAQTCWLEVLPNIDNTLFYFNEDSSGWLDRRAGIKVATDNKREKGQLHLILQGNTSTTFYVLVNLGKEHLFPKYVKTRLVLTQESVIQEKDFFFGTAWMASMIILLISFLNNLHVYYRFRDHAVLFFLFAQVGGMMYITAYRSFFNVIFPSLPFSLILLPNGTSYFYGMNALLMHAGVAILLYGVVQMSRSYLQTKSALPKWDFWLRNGLYGYLIFSVIVALINLSGFYLDHYTLLYDNILVLLVILILLATSIVAYRRKLPSSLTYLLANVLPLLFLLIAVLYNVFISYQKNGYLLLPDLVVVSQALCFSVAIVSRIQILQQALVAKENEAMELAINIENVEYRHREIALENEQIHAAFQEIESKRQASELETQQLSGEMLQQRFTNKNLQDKLEANQRELASNMLYLVQKNALLAELKRQIEELNKLSPNNKHKELSAVKDILQSNLYLDEDWNKFRLHFEQVHPHFFEELQAKYPTLTKNELRLLSYFHINLSTKEIAALLNIDPASVRTAKTRLYKKIAAVDKGLAPE